MLDVSKFIHYHYLEMPVLYHLQTIHVTLSLLGNAWYYNYTCKYYNYLELPIHVQCLNTSLPWKC